MVFHGDEGLRRIGNRRARVLARNNGMVLAEDRLVRPCTRSTFQLTGVSEVIEKLADRISLSQCG